MFDDLDQRRRIEASGSDDRDRSARLGTAGMRARCFSVMSARRSRWAATSKTRRRHVRPSQAHEALVAQQQAQELAFPQPRSITEVAPASISTLRHALQSRVVESQWTSPASSTAAADSSSSAVASSGRATGSRRSRVCRASVCRCLEIAQRDGAFSGWRSSQPSPFRRAFPLRHRRPSSAFVIENRIST